ncbi:MAG: MarR family transcriptional regulator [Gammaproteobacteria bacterium]|jgi:MarR family 2-MHQ and catechol resistance regulon transcriptional repressor
MTVASITKDAAERPFMTVVRELVRAYQAFAAYDAAAYRDTDLTVPQADVVFTLGNTDGLTCKEIGEKTLITKGTLTGVLDRLEAKGLVRRIPRPEDRRSVRIRLTEAGEQVFAERFPRQIAWLEARFKALSPAELEDASRVLRRIRELF